MEMEVGGDGPLSQVFDSFLEPSLTCISMHVCTCTQDLAEGHP